MVVTLTAIPDIPMLRPGDDLAGILIGACEKAGLAPATADIIAVAQKIVSKAEGRYVDLRTIVPSPRARRVAAEVEKDARLVEVILRESRRIVRQRPGVLIVEHRLGFVLANAGVDRSNIDPQAASEPVLLLPEDPDASAADLRARFDGAFGSAPAVIICDSWGRAWRRGSIGAALGAAGIPAVMDLRGQPDLFGHELRVTQTGFADEVACAASLVMGQGNEGRPAVLVRGLTWQGDCSAAAALIRSPEEDLFR
jgi:coenzyme F420-0:L-glutamate ligase/coenzyme F420-1:gamma-L-glutamate ligase